MDSAKGVIRWSLASGTCWQPVRIFEWHMNARMIGRFGKKSMAQAADANIIPPSPSHDVESASTVAVRRCYSKKEQGKGRI